jgi:hypothetical protein
MHANMHARGADGRLAHCQGRAAAATPHKPYPTLACTTAPRVHTSDGARVPRRPSRLSPSRIRPQRPQKQPLDRPSDCHHRGGRGTPGGMGKQQRWRAGWWGGAPGNTPHLMAEHLSTPSKAPRVRMRACMRASMRGEGCTVQRMHTCMQAAGASSRQAWQRTVHMQQPWQPTAA